MQVDSCMKKSQKFCELKESAKVRVKIEIQMLCGLMVNVRGSIKGSSKVLQNDGLLRVELKDRQTFCGLMR